MDIHYTELTSMMRCPRQWYDQYYLKIEPITKAAPLNFGHAFHQNKECFLKGLELPDYDLEHGDISKEDFTLLAKLFKVWVKYYQSKGYKHLLVEHELKAHITGTGAGDVYLCGTVDGIVEDQNGEWWVDETKTVANFDQKHLMLDFQGRVYDLLANENGFIMAGVKYTQIRKQDPDSAKAPIVQEYDVRHGGPSRIITAKTVTHTIDLILKAHEFLASSPDPDEIESYFVRHTNPLVWMPCYCDFQELCWAALMGRESEAMADLYQPRKEVK